MKKLLSLCIMMCLVCTTAYAQCTIKNEAIQAGEKLVYNLKFNWKFVWVDAGTAQLDMEAITYKERPCYRSTLLSVSNKRVDFFFKMRDTITTITTSQLEPLYYRKGAEEGKRYTVDEAWFSYKNNQVIVDQQRFHKGGEVNKNQSIHNECAYDMLSILMRARSFNPEEYKEGDKINFLMTTGRKVEEQTLLYRGKQVVSCQNGTNYRTLVFSLVEYPGGKEKEVITFFVTDDKNHLPIRLDLFLNFGSAKAFLKDVKGNRYPLTSIVE
ncbi:MAG: DUF3108 domain-containing protein [Phocaeicola sp.]